MIIGRRTIDVRIVPTFVMLLVLLVAVVRPSGTPAANAPSHLRAFPDAEGFGAYTPGGRGGKLYVITTLEDNEEKAPAIKGSLREAIEAKGPRIVVFNLSGTIHLKRWLVVSEPYLTIAGQTAPGDGICLADDKTLAVTHDVVIRHLRFRHGDAGIDKTDTLAFRDAQNVIVDHCSISWSPRENLSFSRSSTNATVQWCIISEAIHRKHGYNALVAPSVDSKISFHHNLFANSLGRNPRAASRGAVNFLFDYRNNLTFNWGTGWDWGAWAVYGDGEQVDMNFIGNLAIAGADTFVDRRKGISQRFELTTAGYRETLLSSNRVSSRIYQRDNKIDSNVNGKLDPVDRGWTSIHGVYTKTESEFPISPEFAVRTGPADQVYERVLKDAGAIPWRRDPVDQRIVEGVRNQTGRIIRSQNEVGGWPNLKSESSVDGPRIYAEGDANQSDESGYTKLEIYLNSLCHNRSSN